MFPLACIAGGTMNRSKGQGSTVKVMRSFTLWLIFTPYHLSAIEELTSPCHIQIFVEYIQNTGWARKICTPIFFTLMLLVTICM